MECINANANAVHAQNDQSQMVPPTSSYSEVSINNNNNHNINIKGQEEQLHYGNDLGTTSVVDLKYCNEEIVIWRKIFLCCQKSQG